jgi:diketogulonate reductase-like aldo/keto reductase
VSKVWATYTTRCELGLQKSLEKLGLEYVDLFLVVCFILFFFVFLVVGGVW